MQTGFFYVRLRTDINPEQERCEIDGRSIFLAEALTKGKVCPVLAVDTWIEDGRRETVYHIPMDNNTIGWFPARLFVFARD